MDRYQSLLRFVHPSINRLANYDRKEKELLEQYDHILTKYCGVIPPPKSSKIRILNKDNISDRLDWKFYDPSYINSNDDLAMHYNAWTTIGDISSLNQDYGYGDDQKEQCKLIKVRLHGKGAALRETKKRQKISGPLASASAGEIVFSRIRCAQKGIAIVPKELHGAYVSKEYYLIDVDESIYSTELLFRILLSKRYVSFYKSIMTGGTTRYRMSLDNFICMRIPKIDRSAQNEILKMLKSIEIKITNVRRNRTQYVVQCKDNLQKLLKQLLSLADEVKFQIIETQLQETLQ